MFLCWYCLIEEINGRQGFTVGTGVGQAAFICFLLFVISMNIQYPFLETSFRHSRNGQTHKKSYRKTKEKKLNKNRTL